jgi:hypothetical protein
MVIFALPNNNGAKVLIISAKALAKVDKHAKVAHLVEHDLAKVGVAGSSPVFRSESRQAGGVTGFFLENSSKRVGPGGGIGRHAGLKILFAATRVRVQFPPGARRLSFILK